MKLLLDTHIFIWWADQPDKLSSSTLAALEDETNDLLLSVAWKRSAKHLTQPYDAEAFRIITSRAAYIEFYLKRIKHQF